MSSCVKHPMTVGEMVCGECGHQFCTECVVFPQGASKPPMCIACALEMGGVRRQSTGRPKLSRKSIRERLARQSGPAPADPVGSDVLAPLSPAAPTQDAPTPPGRSDVDAVGTDGTDEPEDPWMEGDLDIEDLPGAWSTSYD